MNVEQFYVADDVLDDASAAKYQLVLTKSKLRYQKEYMHKFFFIKSNFNYA
jgi:hypothetical protein